MKLILTFICFFIFKLSCSQDITVVDFNSNQSIENVSISVGEKNIGFTDINGNYSFQGDLDNVIISFSHVSYETLHIEKQDLNSKIVYLYSKVDVLDEIQIENKKEYNLARGILGGIGVSSKAHLGWNQKAVTYIPFEKSGKITKLQYRTVDMLGVKGLKYLKYKTNLYLIDTITRLPKRQLLTKDILTSNINGDRIFSLDISKHNIQMPKEGIYIVFIILNWDEYEVKSIMSKVGLICATPALKTRVRKNKEKIGIR